MNTSSTPVEAQQRHPFLSVSEIHYVDQEVQAALDGRYGAMFVAAMKARAVALAGFALSILRLPLKAAMATCMAVYSARQFSSISPKRKFVPICLGISGILATIATLSRALSFPFLRAAGVFCPEMSVRVLRLPCYADLD